MSISITNSESYVILLLCDSSVDFLSIFFQGDSTIDYFFFWLSTHAPTNSLNIHFLKSLTISAIAREQSIVVSV